MLGLTWALHLLLLLDGCELGHQAICDLAPQDRLRVAKGAWVGRLCDLRQFKDFLSYV